MVRRAQFESFEDVERYFSLRRELSLIPRAPVDLWEQLDKARKEQSNPNGAALAPYTPESVKIIDASPTRRRKTYEIKVVERIAAPITRAKNVRQAPRPSATALTWKDLL